ncbi:hypothetical protein [Streptomyces sp. NPDC087212]|uniref:hypothetical protein n=1 Tax=Streptomyces sp. NPDC087212 TaxID=3365766 RepID=UPI00380FFA7E
MMHTIEDIEQEKLRVLSRPSPQAAPPVLCFFAIRPVVPVEEYQARLRAVLGPALELAATQSFDDELPEDSIPGWFAAVCGRSSTTVPDFARRGVEHYRTAREGGRWELQEWLDQFDPESEFRGWAWWDLTRSPDGSVKVWVDTWGESFFACDELRWLAFVAGADRVTGPELARIDGWHEAATAE